MANPAPEFFLSSNVGGPPLQGFLVIRPFPGSVGWTYSVDFGNEADTQVGPVDAEVRLPFSLEQPGIHRILVTLMAPTGEVVQHWRSAVVNEPGASLHTEIVVDLLAAEDYSFEGLAIDPAGRYLYAGNYRTGEIFRVNLAAPGATPLHAESAYSLEGLSISSSGEYLFAAYKYRHVARFRLPDLAPDPFIERGGAAAFYITSLDDREAVTSGSGVLTVLDLATRSQTAHAPGDGAPFTAWHHAVSPDGRTVAAVDQNDWSSVHLFRIPDLVPVTFFEWTDFVPILLAFDPEGTTLYALGRDGTLEDIGGTRFLAVDLASGLVRTDEALDDPPSCGLCVANPVATSTDGRWVAFEWAAGGVIFVDTAAHRPVHRLVGGGYRYTGATVAASPTDPAAFWVLSYGGLLRKVTLGP